MKACLRERRQLMTIRPRVIRKAVKAKHDASFAELERREREVPSMQSAMIHVASLAGRVVASAAASSV